jgi:ABC-2 type transport system permease protein
MSAFVREGRLLLQSRAVLLAIVLLALLAGLAVGLGLASVARERAAIERMLVLQQQDEAAVAAYAEDAGSAAYYTFHPIWNAPSDLAFAALGARDIAPSMLRIRALALEGQIYENEAGNPELSLPGRFDLAFVAVYLAPLVIFALFHDLWSGEREAGRLAMLESQPAARCRIWLPRIGVRLALVLAALLLPFTVGAAIASTAPAPAMAFAGLIVLICLFWTAVAMLVARRGQRSAVNAAILAAIWFTVTLVAPAAANIVINAAVPVPDGAVLARENREAVHAGWDKPKAETMQRFFAAHPEWAHSTPVSKPFEWKWYYAFQHLGDLHVAEMSKAYRDGIARRERLASLLGWVLPPLGLQHAMHDLADTGVAAQLAFQDRVRAYHGELRRFYYPYLFNDQPFTREDFAKADNLEGAARSGPACDRHRSPSARREEPGPPCTS